MTIPIHRIMGPPKTQFLCQGMLSLLYFFNPNAGLNINQRKSSSVTAPKAKERRNSSFDSVHEVNKKAVCMRVRVIDITPR